jgi:hypothetical protein
MEAIAPVETTTTEPTMWPDKFPCIMWDLVYKEQVRVLSVLGGHWIIDEGEHTYLVKMDTLTMRMPESVEPLRSQYLEDMDSAGFPNP